MDLQGLGFQCFCGCRSGKRACGTFTAENVVQPQSQNILINLREIFFVTLLHCGLCIVQIKLKYTK